MTSGIPARYTIQGRLGQGGMATVHRAWDRELERDVALKIPHAGEESTRRRFLREARMLARLTHPAIVRVLDVSADEAAPYIVMELIEAPTLRAVLDGGAVAPRQLAELLGEVAQGLDAMHAAGILHRDVKPDNIFLGEDGAKLGDFGLALEIGRGGTLTAPGTLMGTPAYLSPEQLLGHLTGPPADQFALAVVLHEALTGKNPFPGKDPVAIMRARLERPPIPAREHWPDLPHRVERALIRGMARQPEERWPRCVDLTREVIEGLGCAAPQEATLPIVPTHGAGTGAGATRWRRGLAALGLAGALGAAIIVTVLMERDPVVLVPSPPPSAPSIPPVRHLDPELKGKIDAFYDLFGEQIQDVGFVTHVTGLMTPQTKELSTQVVTLLLARIDHLEEARGAQDDDWIVLNDYSERFLVSFARPLELATEERYFLDVPLIAGTLVTFWVPHMARQLARLETRLEAPGPDGMGARYFRGWILSHIRYHRALGKIRYSTASTVNILLGDEKRRVRASVLHAGIVGLSGLVDSSEWSLHACHRLVGLRLNHFHRCEDLVRVPQGQTDRIRTAGRSLLLALEDVDPSCPEAELSSIPGDHWTEAAASMLRPLLVAAPGGTPDGRQIARFVSALRRHHARLDPSHPNLEAATRLMFGEGLARLATHVTDPGVLRFIDELMDRVKSTK